MERHKRLECCCLYLRSTASPDPQQTDKEFCDQRNHICFTTPTANRSSVTNNGVEGRYIMHAGVPLPGDYQMNQYSETPFGLQEFDDNGSRILRSSPNGNFTYHYDYANRLVAIDSEDAVGQNIRVSTYSYDPLGRRITKSVYDAQGANPVTTTFFLDDHVDDDCNRHSGADSSGLVSYIGQSIDKVYITAGSADRTTPPVAILDAEGKCPLHTPGSIWKCAGPDRFSWWNR